MRGQVLLAVSRAVTKVFKGDQSSTASGDAMRILLAKKHRENLHVVVATSC